VLDADLNRAKRIGAKPERRGGTALLESAIPNVRLDYAPAGLICEFDFLLWDEARRSTTDQKLATSDPIQQIPFGSAA
jgi:hypothetical protein